MGLIWSRRTTIAALACVLLAGCGKTDEGKETPHNPLLQPPKAGAGGIRRMADRPKVRNELSQLYTFYNLYINDQGQGHPPKTLEEFKSYIARDARELHQQLSEGYYVLVVGKKVSGSDVLAYEKAPDAKGDHIVIRADHSLDTLKTDALTRALQNAN